VFCYSDVVRPDQTTRRLKQYAHQWRNIRGKNTEEVCRLIQSDQIDILVDLAGHTANNRMPVFARRVALIQVTYLGYPNTTGLPTVDYLITDGWVDPPGSETGYVEKLLRLPGGFSCYQPSGEDVQVNDQPAKAPGEVTLASLNNPAKLNDNVIELWSRILTALPNARLLLQGKAFADQGTRHRLEQRFSTHNVSADRLVLLRSMNFREHLSVYHQVDIALDPFPWNGHTTSCHALWMGVPTITLYGKAHAGRMAASVLHQIGLPELIAQSKNEYLDKVITLAHDLPRLSELRYTMRSRMLASPLCDGKSFTRDLEAAYREMWRKYCKTQAAN
jgi:predicted O-linked N-acetylglucosamine transferase (SPINDLY family)